MASLEKRKKFLPCVVHTNHRKDTYKIFVFPDKNVLVNPFHSCDSSFDKTGYVIKRSTEVDLTDFQTPIYKTTLQLIPKVTDKVAKVEQPEPANQSFDSDDDNNNNNYPGHFITTVTIPC